KRRKEPGKDGMERSSFHHTKSSKEYLRKAQEALRMHQQEQVNASTNVKADDPAKIDVDVAANMHSPRTNFRILNQGSTLSSSIAAPPFSRSQSCGSVMIGRRTELNQGGSVQAASDPYGYEDPDAAAASKTSSTPQKASNENPYGYEDADTFVPPPRRMGPARRRGSVTKYSLQAANAAQKATERIMKLQGLNWKGTMGDANAATRKESPSSRATTPTRSRHAPRVMETSMHGSGPSGDQSQPMAPPVRRRSIPMDVGMEPKEAANPYGYDDVAMAGDDNNMNANMKETLSISNQYGYEDPDASVAATANSCATTASSPYGYENCDKVPQQPRRHPRARRRGSVTKFSLEAAQTIASSHPAPSIPSSEGGSDSMLPNGGDFIMALKPPADSRPNKGLTPRNRRRTLDPGQGDGANPLSRNNSGSSEQGLSPRRSAPCRSGSTRSASSRHLARFGAPSRSSSFMSHGSAASFEDDVDSLAPDMESLCSIHDRDLGTEFDLGPVAAPMSPLTPGVSSASRSKSLSKTFSNKSDSGLDSFLLERRKSLSERSNFPVVSIPNNGGDFAILPFAASGSDARSSARMPAPVRRTPSRTASGCKQLVHAGRLSSSASSESAIDAS
ncbi:MAG: hypothetical protein SGILL_002213, partial [Bacillariaceae sp.]